VTFFLTVTLPGVRRAPTLQAVSTARRPESLLRGELTTIRPATAEDAELLAGWYADPEVACFWDWKTYTAEQIVERLARPHVDAYIVEADGEPVGYLQAWFGANVDVGGLDMFLIPAARGRRLGPDAASTLARFLLDQGGRMRVTVDPYLWNERAVRGWKNAGFRPVEECEPDEEHQHRWLLMEFDRRQ
jgi:aminoglycoside 6'-N-acetyltransferase